MGYIHVYTGNGKGKTTAAFGLAMRAAGKGKRVCIVQFMKPGNRYGEQISADRLGIEIHSFGTERFVNKKNPREEDIRLAREALTMSREKLKSGDYDVVILDEVNVAMDFGLVPVEDVVDTLKSRNEKTEVILTGRHAPEQIVEIADLVTEMKEIKHYFRAGVVAREGIEY